jgi:hypothetical protein
LTGIFWSDALPDTTNVSFCGWPGPTTYKPNDLFSEPRLLFYNIPLVSLKRQTEDVPEEHERFLVGQEYEDWRPYGLTYQPSTSNVIGLS